MATAHQIRDLIAQTTTGTARPRVPREVRDEVCRYAGRRRRQGAAWAVMPGRPASKSASSSDGTREPGPPLRSRCCVRSKWCRNRRRRRIWH